MLKYYKYTDTIEGNDGATIVYAYACATAIINKSPELNSLIETGVNFNDCSKVESLVLSDAINHIKNVICVDKADLEKAIKVIADSKRKIFSLSNGLNAEMSAVELVGCPKEMIVFMKELDVRRELYINVISDLTSVIK